MAGFVEMPGILAFDNQIMARKTGRSACQSGNLDFAEYCQAKRRTRPRLEKSESTATETKTGALLFKTEKKQKCMLVETAQDHNFV